MRRRVALGLLIGAVLGGAASAQPVLDGRDIPNEFCQVFLRASQTNYTGFGDNYSELDQVFAYFDRATLYVGITGNLEGNGNNYHIYIDSAPGGPNPFNLTTGCINCSVQGMSGVVFDEDFAPEWALGISHYQDVVYVDLHDLVNNVSTYLGSNPMNSGEGDLDIDPDFKVAFDNTNTQGITSDPFNLGDPSTATTGAEVAIPLGRINYTGGRIRILVLLTGGADLTNVCSDGVTPLGTYMSNQSLPALNIGNPSQQFDNIAWSHCPNWGSSPFNFGTDAPGIQYTEVLPSAEITGDGVINDADLSQLLLDFGTNQSRSDIDGDGIVADSDLGLLLLQFGCAF